MVLCQFYVNQDFPEDPSGSFDQFKDFVRSNFNICKWIGLSIVTVQVSLCQLSECYFTYDRTRRITIWLSRCRRRCCCCYYYYYYYFNGPSLNPAIFGRWEIPSILLFRPPLGIESQILWEQTTDVSTSSLKLPLMGG